MLHSMCYSIMSQFAIPVKKYVFYVIYTFILGHNIFNHALKTVCQYGNMTVLEEREIL